MHLFLGLVDNDLCLVGLPGRLIDLLVGFEDLLLLIKFLHILNILDIDSVGILNLSSHSYGIFYITLSRSSIGTGFLNESNDLFDFGSLIRDVLLCFLFIEFLDGTFLLLLS
jgi:hypothetical protein